MAPARGTRADGGPVGGRPAVSHPRLNGPSLAGAARVAAVAVAVLVAAVGLAGPAAADGGSAAADLRVAQSLGDRQLTVLLRWTGPGPLRVDVVQHAGPAGALVVTAVDAGAVADRAALTLPERPGTAGATLRVGRAGPWELRLDDGERTARIPFVVTPRVSAPWERAAYGGWVAAGVSLLVAVVVAGRARRRWTPLVPAAGVVVGVTVAVTAALLSATIPPPVEPGRFVDATRDTVADPYPGATPGPETSRPPVNVLVSAPQAAAGRPVDVVLELTDSGTGRPVDDLLVHHEALVHLVVVGPSGRVWHLHPACVGPGRCTARLTPEAGRHAVTAEVARRGGGVQQVRTVLDVPGGRGGPLEIATVEHGRSPAAAEGCQQGGLTAIGCEQSHLAGTSAPASGTVSVDPAPAGSPTVLTAAFGDAPTLQPWLGMAGHLLVSGPLPAEPGGVDGAIHTPGTGTAGTGTGGTSTVGAGTVGTGTVGAAVAAAPVWAHVHAVPEAPTAARTDVAAPDVTVAAFGPQVRFVFTFPHAGRYRLWFQAMRDHTVLTVPATVDVLPRTTP